MSSIIPYVTATGVQQVESAYYTLTNGALASQVVLRILPQSTTVPPRIHVTFVGGFAAVPLNNCVLDFGSIKKNLRGEVVSLRVWDRRYWWQFAGEINARFNIHLPDGSIDTRNKKSLRQLAVTCLQLAGESNYSVGALPNDVYPEVEWEYQKPMLALDKLLSQHGYEICWNPLNDLVHIEQDGVGADLPLTSDTSGSSLDMDFNAAPNFLNIICAPALVQAKLKIESVMPEPNGGLVPTDDSSIKPASGWNYQQGTQFEDVAAEHGDDAASLARQAYGKWYRVTKFADDTLNCPGYPDNPLPDILHISPLNHLLAETYTPVGSSLTVEKPAYVQGRFLPGGDEDGIEPVENTEPTERVEGYFDLERHQMLVKFSSPVLKKDGSSLVPADLWLTASFEVTNRESLLKDRYVYRHNMGTGGPGAHNEDREDIQRRVIAEYPDDDPTESPTVDDNLEDVAEEARIQAIIASRQFLTRVGRVRIYRDIQPIFTDGAIKQVMWMQNTKEGADTIAGRYTQFDVGTLRQKERNRIVDLIADRGDKSRRSVRRRRERTELR